VYHAILADEREWADNEAEGERLQAGYARHLAAVAGVHEAHRADLARYQADYALAMMNGTDPPPRPPDPPVAPSVFPDLLAQHAQRRDELIRRLAPKVEQRARQRETKLAEQARKTPPARWGPLVDELRSLLEAVRLVLGGARQLVSDVTELDLFMVMIGRRSVFDVEPPREPLVTVAEESRPASEPPPRHVYIGVGRNTVEVLDDGVDVSKAPVDQAELDRLREAKAAARRPTSSLI